METSLKYFRDDDIEPLLDNPGKAFFEYWKTLRRDRPYPAKSEFDPMRVVRALPGIQIIERAEAPVEFKYRLVGTREVEARGWDPTGRPVAEGFVGPEADSSLNHFRMTVESGAPLCVSGIFLQHNDVWADVIALFLPMADAAGDLQYVFTYTYHIPIKDRH